MQTIPSDHVRLLWTGGWDSTFRLLDLVFTYEVPVQPFYLVNTDRRSTLREFDAMAEIRSAVAERSGEVAARICPSVVLARHDLAPDAEISAQYKRLTARRHLGPQYEWLARMAKQLGLKDLELGIIDGGRGAAVFEGQLHKVEGEPGGPNLALCDEALDSDLGFFKYFRFPVLHLDKKHLQRLSDQRGFIDIMQLTWFCHSPRLGKPCGVCPPCTFARDDGFGWRIPFYRNSRLYRFGWRTLRSVKDRLLGFRSGR